MAAKCWLWPNRIINKADSGKLRDEHKECHYADVNGGQV